MQKGKHCIKGQASAELQSEMRFVTQSIVTDKMSKRIKAPPQTFKKKKRSLSPLRQEEKPTFDEYLRANLQQFQGKKLNSTLPEHEGILNRVRQTVEQFNHILQPNPVELKPVKVQKLSIITTKQDNLFLEGRPHEESRTVQHKTMHFASSVSPHKKLMPQEITSHKIGNWSAQRKPFLSNQPSKGQLLPPLTHQPPLPDKAFVPQIKRKKTLLRNQLPLEAGKVTVKQAL